MPFDPTLASIRFGLGLSPVVAPPASAEEMMALLADPDVMAEQVPLPTYSEVYPSLNDIREASRAVNQARGTQAEDAAQEARRALRAAGREAVGAHMRANLARAALTRDGFRERLTLFWADHFTVRAVNGGHRHLVSPYIEEAIRPHVAGRFADMLIAAVLNPLMIFYLNQHQSMGPNSQAAQRRDSGLNENLAREMLELHTLGVGGAYTQDDVRQMAELLTGVTASAQRGAFFREQQAEPGAETVLGETYGGAEESLDHVVAALEDLAMHPDTARHLARKLLVHFVGPVPDEALVEAMAARYLASGGSLLPLYEVMLESEVAWTPTLQKAKQPIDFIASAIRALAVPQETILGATRRDMLRAVQRPLAVMGQVWQSPVGPDGWPEDDAAWITPQGMAGRITWSMTVPQQLLDALPDPRDFIYHALGPTPPEAVIFAAGAAETVSDGIGIVLASAAFQRR